MTDFGDHPHTKGSGSEPSFSHPETARRLRDAIEKVVTDQVNSMRPLDQYGVVTGIDPDGRKVWVDINSVGTSIPVHVGSIMPTAIGQRVRISTVRPGDMVVTDVYGTSVLTAETKPELPNVTGLGVSSGNEQLFLTWDDVAPKYEVQAAEDVGFTTGVRGPWITNNNGITVSDLIGATTYYVRVRSVNSSETQVDDFWATGSGVPAVQPGGSDGSPPDSPSPQPTCVAGIGMIAATWAAATGTVDTVIYEVHVSTISGFTPSPETLLIESSSRFVSITHLPDGLPFLGGGSLQLLYGTNIFVRIIAKDVDGTASMSAQGFAAPLRVELGDVGSIVASDLSDGSAPTSSPAATVTGGFGYMYLKWDHITNVDPVDYEVHMSANSGFTPTSTTLVGSTPSNFFFIRNRSAQAGGGDLDPDVTYYVKIVATDEDGSAPASSQTSGNSSRIPTDAIQQLAISEALIADAAITNAKIADLAVDNAKIVDLSVTNAKIGALAVGTANIQALAVTEALIADLSVSTAKIQNLAVTDAQIDNLTVEKLRGGSITAQAITLDGFGGITIGTLGYLQSANFVDGVSGYQLLSDNAQLNNVTIRGAAHIGGTLNGTTGTFAGELQAVTGTFDVVTVNNTIRSSNHVSFTTGWAMGGTYGFELNSGQMHIGGGGNDSFHLIDDGTHWAGHQDYASAPFRVSKEGGLRALFAEITGNVNITSGSLNIGGGNGFHVENNGNFYTGGAPFNSATWRVSSDGFMSIGGFDYASAFFQVTNTGDLTATNATVQGTINSSTINSSSIYTGYIEGGTVAGAFIRSSVSASANRVEMSGSDIRFYNGATFTGYIDGYSTFGNPFFSSTGTRSIGLKTAGSGDVFLETGAAGGGVYMNIGGVTATAYNAEFGREPTFGLAAKNVFWGQNVFPNTGSGAAESGYNLRWTAAGVIYYENSTARVKRNIRNADRTAPPGGFPKIARLYERVGEDDGVEELSAVAEEMAAIDPKLANYGQMAVVGTGQPGDPTLQYDENEPLAPVDINDRAILVTNWDRISDLEALRIPLKFSNANTRMDELEARIAALEA